MSGRSDRCYETPTSATTLLLRRQARSDRCYGTPTSVTTLLLRGQTRSDWCYDTPASATTLLLRGQARISLVLYQTFGFLVYYVHLIHGSRSR